MSRAEEMPENLTEYVNVRLAPTMLDKLAELASAGDRSVAAEIRRAIREHLEREDADR